MSGRLWVVNGAAPATSHDHFDLLLENGTVVRLRDPRRFGLVLWQKGDPLAHPLLAEHRARAVLRGLRRRMAASRYAQPQRGDQAAC